MRFGICARFQHVATFKDLSFLDYLEEGVQRFLVPELPYAHFAALLQQARMSLPLPIEAANSLLPADLVLVDTRAQRVDTLRLERYIKTVLERAAEAGIRVLVFGSGNARACPPDFDRAQAMQQISMHLETWSNWARGYNVQFVLEPLRYDETNTFNTVAESGEAIAAIAPSGARLLADLYHMAANGEAAASLIPQGPYLTHVHVAELEGRTAPGYHGDDFCAYFAALHRIHYDQRISIECNWHDLSSEAALAIAYIKDQWKTSDHNI